MNKRVLYIWGDGGIWKLSPKQRAAAASGAPWLEVAKELRASKNFKKGRWEGLPTSIAQDETGRLYLTVNGADLVSYDDIWDAL